MFHLASRTTVTAAAIFLTFLSAQAQDRRQNRPGQFDYYVLALSWSPSFCEGSAERGREQKGQCGHLRQPTAERSSHLPEQGFSLPRLRGDRPPRLPARQAANATRARRARSCPQHPLICCALFIVRETMAMRR